MGDSSKANAIKSPGFLTSLQQKAGLCTLRTVIETKDTKQPGGKKQELSCLTQVSSHGSWTGNLWQNGSNLIGSESWKPRCWAGFRPPDSQDEGGDQACTTGRALPVRGRVVRNWQDINTSEGRTQRIKESKRSLVEVQITVTNQETKIPFPWDIVVFLSPSQHSLLPSNKSQRKIPCVKKQSLC